MQFHGVGFICEVIIINQSNIRREDVRTRGNGDPRTFHPKPRAQIPSIVRVNTTQFHADWSNKCCLFSPSVRMDDGPQSRGNEVSMEKKCSQGRQRWALHGTDGDNKGGYSARIHHC